MHGRLRKGHQGKSIDRHHTPCSLFRRMRRPSDRLPRLDGRRGCPARHPAINASRRPHAASLLGTVGLPALLSSPALQLGFFVYSSADELSPELKRGASKRSGAGAHTFPWDRPISFDRVGQHNPPIRRISHRPLRIRSTPTGTDGRSRWQHFIQPVAYRNAPAAPVVLLLLLQLLKRAGGGRGGD